MHRFYSISSSTTKNIIKQNIRLKIIRDKQDETTFGDNQELSNSPQFCDLAKENPKQKQSVHQ